MLIADDHGSYVLERLGPFCRLGPLRPFLADHADCLRQMLFWKAV